MHPYISQCDITTLLLWYVIMYHGFVYQKYHTSINYINAAVSSLASCSHSRNLTVLTFWQPKWKIHDLSRHQTNNHWMMITNCQSNSHYRKLLSFSSQCQWEHSNIFTPKSPWIQTQQCQKQRIRQTQVGLPHREMNAFAREHNRTNEDTTGQVRTTRWFGWHRNVIMSPVDPVSSSSVSSSSSVAN